MAPARTSRLAGVIAYYDGAGADVGRERFEILGHGGGFGFRALCEMDDIGLLRDVTMAFDGEWRPLDGFCRIVQGGALAAATWFGVADDAVALEGQVMRGDRLERASDRLTRASRLGYLGLHPLQGDALIVNRFPPETPRGVFVAVDAVTNSHSPDGEERVGLHPIAIDLALLGGGTVDVRAGRFAARRFAVRWRADWPPAEFWVREADSVLLRLDWPIMGRSFELVALEEEGEER